MPTLTLTLSRAHHLAERAAARAADLQREAIALFGSTSLSLPSSVNDDLMVALTESRARAEQCVEDAAVLILAAAALRDRIADANHEHGVTQLLGEMARVKRQMSLYQALADINPINRVELNQAALQAAVSEARALRSTATYDGDSRSVRVRLMPDSLSKHLRTLARNCQTQLDRVTDTLAARNSAQIAVEIAPRAGELLGVVDPDA